MGQILDGFLYSRQLPKINRPLIRIADTTLICRYRSNIKSEQHHIAFLHNVFFALTADQSFFFGVIH